MIFPSEPLFLPDGIIAPDTVKLQPFSRLLLLDSHQFLTPGTINSFSAQINQIYFPSFMFYLITLR